MTEAIQTVGFEIPNSPLKAELKISRAGKKPQIELQVTGFANQHLLDSPYIGEETEDPRYSAAAHDLITITKSIMERSGLLRVHKKTREYDITMTKPGINTLTITARYPDDHAIMFPPTDNGRAEALFVQLQEQLGAYLQQGGLQELLKQHAGDVVPDPAQRTPEARKVIKSIKEGQERGKEKVDLFHSIKRLHPDVNDKDAVGIAGFAEKLLHAEREKAKKALKEALKPGVN